MTPEQQEGIVAGFLHVLDRSDSVRREWLGVVEANATKSAEDRAEALGTLVQKTLGLAQAPTADDMTQMVGHANRALAERVAQVRAHDDVPRTVAVMFNHN